MVDVSAMNIDEHHKEFRRIIEKYSLNDEKTSEAIAHYLTDNSRKHISPSEFAKEFEMEEKDAEIFLQFVEKGLMFKAKHMASK
jgi:hypothetical protein